MKFDWMLLKLAVFLMCIDLLSIGRATAAVSVDRTRAIVNGIKGQALISIHNTSSDKPYLVQTWLETLDGKKDGIPLRVMPVLQRVEMGKRAVIRIMTDPQINRLPTDEESVFYIAIREIPPVANEPNKLQLALQTKIKVFYRPDLMLKKAYKHWDNELRLRKIQGGYEIINPTAYNATIINLFEHQDMMKSTGFTPVMIKPNGRVQVNSPHHAIPALQTITDHGGKPVIAFECNQNTCTPKKNDER